MLDYTVHFSEPQLHLKCLETAAFVLWCSVSLFSKLLALLLAALKKFKIPVLVSF